MTDYITLEGARRARDLLTAVLPRDRGAGPRSDTDREPNSLPTWLGLTPAEVKRYSVLRMTRHVCANADGKWRQCATFESELALEIERNMKRPTNSTDGFFLPYEIQTRADTVGAASAGGYLVETELVSFIDLLRNRTVAFRLGAYDLNGLVANVAVPKLTGAATATWLTTEITQANGGASSNQSFSQLGMSPKNVAAYTEISRQLLLQSTPSAEKVVMGDLAQVLAIAVDEAAINGNGTAGSPVGILNYPAVQVFGGTVSTIPWASFLSMEGSLLTSNVPMIAAGWATTPALAQTLAGRQQFTNSSIPIWDGPLRDGEINGNHAMSSLQIPSGTLIFGDWSQMVIASWGMLEIEVNPYANFLAGMIGVRAILSCDIGLRNAVGFTVATGVS